MCILNRIIAGARQTSELNKILSVGTVFRSWKCPSTSFSNYHSTPTNQTSAPPWTGQSTSDGSTEQRDTKLIFNTFNTQTFNGLSRLASNAVQSCSFSTRPEFYHLGLPAPTSAEIAEKLKQWRVSSLSVRKRYRQNIECMIHPGKYTRQTTGWRTAATKCPDPCGTSKGGKGGKEGKDESPCVPKPISEKCRKSILHPDKKKSGKKEKGKGKGAKCSSLLTANPDPDSKKLTQETGTGCSLCDRIHRREKRMRLVTTKECRYNPYKTESVRQKKRTRCAVCGMHQRKGTICSFCELFAGKQESDGCHCAEETPGRVNVQTLSKNRDVHTNMTLKPPELHSTLHQSTLGVKHMPIRTRMSGVEAKEELAMFDVICAEEMLKKKLERIDSATAREVSKEVLHKKIKNALKIQ